MKKEYYRTIFRGPDMDTETVFKIIEMLETRIAECNNFIDSDALDYDQVRYVSGTLFGLEEFRDYLQNGGIEPKVNQAEDQMNEGGY